LGSFKELGEVLGGNEIEVVLPGLVVEGQVVVEHVEVAFAVAEFGGGAILVAVFLALDLNDEDVVGGGQADEKVGIEVVVADVGPGAASGLIGVRKAVKAAVRHLDERSEQVRVFDQPAGKDALGFVGGVEDVPGGFQRSGVHRFQGFCDKAGVL